MLIFESVSPKDMQTPEDAEFETLARKRALEIKTAKHRAELKAIERRTYLVALSEYAGFFVSKIGSVAMIFVGSSEWVEPDWLAITLAKPEAFIGAGIALLGGKRLADVLSKLFSALK